MNALRELWRALGEVVSPEEATIALAAPGETSKIEVARPGSFEDMHGTAVTFTPENLASMASSFETDKDHKLKLGHTPILTDTPDYGDVVGLEYEPNKQRLLAHVRPTEALVEKNRKGAFRRASMELSLAGENQYSFRHLSLLGAKRPAVKGLAEVQLAEDEPEAGVLAVLADSDPEDANVFLKEFTTKERDKLAEKDMAMPDGSYPIRNKSDLANAIQAIGRAKDPAAVRAHCIKRAKALDAMDMIPESWLAEKVAAPAADNKEIKMADESAMAEKEKQFKERRLKFAQEVADAFLGSEAIIKRIPMPVLKAGNLQRLALRLSEMEVEGEGGTVELAAADGTKTVSTPWEVFKSLLLSFPEKLASDETKELARNGAEDEPDIQAAQGNVDKDSADRDQAAQKLMFAAKQKGESLTYLDAVRQVDIARSK